MKKKNLWLWLGVGLAALLVIASVVFLVIQWKNARQEVSGTCEQHIDKNDDGFCDRCKKDITVTVDFFAINDLHGKVVDGSTQPGIDELTTYLKTAGTNTVLISSGDMWQGSSESNLSGGNLVTDWMNQMKFDAMALGNHEFDWGTDLIKENVAMAEFPMLAINVFSKETDRRVEYAQPSTIIERNGIKIGIIGAIGNCMSSISSDKTTEIYFVTGSELSVLIQKESQKLREEGAQFVVLTIHDGFGESFGTTRRLSSARFESYYDTSLSGRYVDLVFEGHTHQSYILKDMKDVYHLQAGGENRGISHAAVRFNPVTNSFKVVTAEIISNTIYMRSASDSLINELLEKYNAQIEKGHDEIGYNPTYRDDVYLKSKVAELYYQVGIETWGDDYDIVCGGGFLSIRNPYSLKVGNIKYSDLQSLFPFDNQIVLCSVQGKYLRSQFLETDNKNYYIYCGEYGEDVRRSLDPEKTYYIVIDTYSSQYEPNHCTVIDSYTEGVFARDLLFDFLSEELGGSGEKPHVNYELTTIPEILSIGAQLEANKFSSKAYYVEGKIQSISNDTYGNLTIVDGEGNTLYIYGINDKSGNTRWDSIINPPHVGDTVVLYGVIEHYVPSEETDLIEMYKALLIR